jgi:hypothetical protein
MVAQKGSTKQTASTSVESRGPLEDLFLSDQENLTAAATIVRIAGRHDIADAHGDECSRLMLPLNGATQVASETFEALSGGGGLPKVARFESEAQAKRLEGAVNDAQFYVLSAATIVEFATQHLGGCIEDDACNELMLPIRGLLTQANEGLGELEYAPKPVIFAPKIAA